MHFRPRLSFALVLVTLLAPIWPAASRGDDGRAPLTVGTLTLDPCEAAAPDGWCGSIERPIDPSGAVPGTIRIGFEWYEHDRRFSSAGTIVAMQGGPGFGTTWGRDWFREVLDPTTFNHDLLLLDARGTGTSEAIDCPEAQQAPPFESEATTACAARLGDRAGLYGTAAAADDLAALLDALGVGRIDYYGPSYGTVFGQVFAWRHRDRLRSMVLDSALPADLPMLARDRATWQTGWRGLDLACRRDAGCSALPGTTHERIGALLTALRLSPVTRTVTDADGAESTVTVDPEALLRLIVVAGRVPAVYRELDAAARSWLAGDLAPLLRLVGEPGIGEMVAHYEPSIGSVGALVAITCTDFAMPFDPRADEATRRAQFEAMIADVKATQPTLLAPFRLEELPTMERDSVNCTEWPAPPASVIPAWQILAGTDAPAVPTLVLSGELDTITPPAAGAIVAARLPGALHVVVPNAGHGVATLAPWLTLPWTDRISCVRRLINVFVWTLAPVDGACLATLPPLRLVGSFPPKVAEVTPALATSGAPSDADLRLAAALVHTTADAVLHGWARPYGPSAGLRGGTIELFRSTDGYVLVLKDVRWVEDVSVSGSIRLLGETGLVTGSFAVVDAEDETGTITVGWYETAAEPVAAIAGTIGGRPLYASMPAP